jgi:glycosyltransferase involved in cell wall biosynthesis
MISVVIPCYNAAATLSSTLESVLAQESVAEIVVNDDGSRDHTLSVARSYEPRVRVLTGPNVGVSEARNRGATATTAPWLLFLDSDDMLEPGTIAARLTKARESGAEVVISDWREFTSDDTTLGPTRSVDWPLLEKGAEVGIATSVWATTAAILYHRSIFDKIGGFRRDLPVIQDARFLFDAAYHGARFAHAPHVGARYRILPGSLSRRDPARFLLDLLLNGEQIEALWRARGALSQEQLTCLSTIYYQVARGLFAAGHPMYFEAVRRQQALAVPLPVHSRIAVPLACLLGLSTARSLMRLARAAASPFRPSRTSLR